LGIAVLLVAATAALTAAARAPIAGRPVEFDIPYAIESWRGVDAEPLDPETERTIAADLIVNRTYAAPDGAALGFYLAYYSQQRPGVSMHSPLHCLPGTGWDILSNDTMRADLGDGTRGAIRRLVAQKGSARALILYWYSIHGRMIANDARSRLQLLDDRIRLGRNDGALVRLVVPVLGSDMEAEKQGVAFARALVPHL
jgi:EpsI family protein